MSLTATPSSGMVPLLVSFNATVPGGAGPVVVNWSFGDGATLSGSGPHALTPAHEYTVAGSFTAQVTVSDSQGVGQNATLIRVTAAPMTASISESPSSGPVPLTVTFTAGVHGGSGTYRQFLWQFGDGGQGEGASVRYTYSRPGVYQVNLTATDSQNRSANASVTIILTGAASTPANGAAADPPPNLWIPGGLVVAGLAIFGLVLYAVLARRDRWEETPVAKHPGGAGPSLGEPTDRGLSAEGVGGHSELSSIPKGGEDIGAGGDDPAPTPPATRSPPVFARKLADRILEHLLSQRPVAATEAPGPERTQAGIAESLGTQQNVVSKVLLRLTAAGLVTAESRAVLRQPRRLKVYRLTLAGEGVARARREGTWPRTSPPDLPDPVPEADPGSVAS